jgi:hypothetical protein
MLVSFSYSVHDIKASIQVRCLPSRHSQARLAERSGRQDCAGAERRRPTAVEDMFDVKEQ